jgi:hypothetical protein
MNDKTRLELEQYFDSELPAHERAGAACLLDEDGEARRYLARLAELRAVAQRHERATHRPSSEVRMPLSSRSRMWRAWGIAAAALAAIVVPVVVWRRQSTFEAPGAPGLTFVAGPTKFPPCDDSSIQSDEIALYTWANTDQRRPEAAASALLLPRMRSGKRPAAVEILALELANASAPHADKLEPIAVVHRHVPGGRGSSEWRGRHARPLTPGAWQPVNVRLRTVSWG